MSRNENALLRWIKGLVPLVCVVAATAILIQYRGYLLGLDDETKEPESSLIGDAALAIQNPRNTAAIPPGASSIDRLSFTQTQPVDPNLEARGRFTEAHYFNRGAHFASAAGWTAVSRIRKAVVRVLTLYEMIELMDRYKAWRSYLWLPPEPEPTETKPDSETTD